MKLAFYKTILLLCLLLFFFANNLVAASFVEINIDNGISKSTVTLKFNSHPIYRFFCLHDPERAILDIVQHNQINMNVFPINFDNKNLIRCVRSSLSVNRLNLRLVFDITDFFITDKILDYRSNSECSSLILVFKRRSTSYIKSMNLYNDFFVHCKRLFCFINDKKKYFIDNSTLILKRSLILVFHKYNIKKKHEPIIIAIDAGHGGQDPGAIGFDGLCEKDVTIAIALKLKKYLNSDKLFKPVLVRDGDYFISVMDRSEIARKKRANFLVSIHTDASLNKNISGASLWVLSNKRANSEINNLLEHRGRRSKLLGGVAKLFTSNQLNPYFNEVILDLQFNYSQRVSYECSVQVLHYLSAITKLHQNQPKFSNFGVLCSPDIPSVLIETGFISNLFEEKILSTSFYQEKIAAAIYRGLRSYFMKCSSYPLASKIINITTLSHDNNQKRSFSLF